MVKAKNSTFILVALAINFNLIYTLPISDSDSAMNTILRFLAQIMIQTKLIEVFPIYALSFELTCILHTFSVTDTPLPSTTSDLQNIENYVFQCTRPYHIYIYLYVHWHTISLATFVHSTPCYTFHIQCT